MRQSSLLSVGSFSSSSSVGMLFSICVTLVILTSGPTSAWQAVPALHCPHRARIVNSIALPSQQTRQFYSTPLHSMHGRGENGNDPDDTTTTTTTKTETEMTTTEKFGLEAGLFESLKIGGEEGGATAKELLQKYGVAYLATSIPLAALSFAICYVLVDNGVDVTGLLAKVGIVQEGSTKVGTVAIAYAAHKASSPIRFPPTVLLTPVVAKLLGKEAVVEAEGNNGGDGAAEE